MQLCGASLDKAADRWADSLPAEQTFTGLCVSFAPFIFWAGFLAFVAIAIVATSRAAADPLCGNNIIEQPEQCDDGNTISGDACSADCRVEIGHLSCGLGASVDCGLVCGDGILAGSESCDDGNSVDGDGCSHSCSIEQPVTYDCPLAFDQRQRALFPDYVSPRANGGYAATTALQPLSANFEPVLDAIPYCNGLPLETASKNFLLEYKILIVLDQSWIDFYTANNTAFGAQGYDNLVESPQLLFDRVNYIYARQFGIRFSTRTVVAEGLIEDCREGSNQPENPDIPETLTLLALQNLGVEKASDEAMIYRIGAGGSAAYCHSYASFYPFGREGVASNQVAPFSEDGKLNHQAAVTLAHELGHSFGMLSNTAHPHHDTAHLIDQVPDIMVYNGMPVETVRPDGMFWNFLTSCTPTYTQNVCAGVKATSRALGTRLVCNEGYGDCLVDTNADGVANDEAADDDGDGFADGEDDFPLDPAAAVDTDQDGLPDQWVVGFAETDSTSRPRLTLDQDDDNDGVTDTQDSFPTDPTEFIDRDDDGLGDNADQCDDTPAAEIADIDMSGCGASERDTDGDGVNDSLDAFPNNPGEALDTDGDGYGDNEEHEAGTDPADANDTPVQSSLPVWLLYQATQ